MFTPQVDRDWHYANIVAIKRGNQYYLLKNRYSNTGGITLPGQTASPAIDEAAFAELRERGTPYVIVYGEDGKRIEDIPRNLRIT